MGKNQLKCPRCGEVFEAEASGYAAIVKQVRDAEFQAELKEREAYLQAKEQNEAAKERFLMEKRIAEKDLELQQVKSMLAQKDAEAESNVAKALFSKEKELSEVRGELADLNGKFALQASEAKLRESSMASAYEEKLKQKDEQIAYYKDFKARQSTKMVGESLEQHCLAEFNKVRMMAFPKAYFEKDNEIKEGSKGDFIFRESSEDGVEFLSIMFEMKNEADETATKHKNEDFLKELDKDRKAKGCEYAVLVSLLEADNEYYNSGIVTAYQHEKMYIIRPQFFLPLIGLLRNMALSSLAYRQELAEVKNRQLDLSHFEENMEEFKASVSRNYRIASEKFQTAVAEIDKTIEHLQKVRAALVSSENNLRLIDKKSEDLSIRKLTKNAPSIRALLEESTEV